MANKPRGKNRYFNTTFWDDPYIRKLMKDNNDPGFRLFLCLFTNPRTNICGIYEITIDHLCFYTCLSEKVVSDQLSKFEKDKKMMYRDGWLAIKNFIKHQNPNKNSQIGIINGLIEAPGELVEWVVDKEILVILQNYEGNERLFEFYKSFPKVVNL